MMLQQLDIINKFFPVYLIPFIPLIWKMIDELWGFIKIKMESALFFTLYTDNAPPNNTLEYSALLEILNEVRWLNSQASVKVGEECVGYGTSYGKLSGLLFKLNRNDLSQKDALGHIMSTKPESCEIIVPRIYKNKFLIVLNESWKKKYDASKQEKSTKIYTDNGADYSFYPKPRYRISMSEFPPIKDLEQDLDKFLNRDFSMISIDGRCKRTYLLYGPPGTGKTSMIKYLAHKTGCILPLDLSLLSDNNNLGSFFSRPRITSILLEDLDRFFDENKGLLPESKFSLSSLLNALDGAFTDNIVVFITCNDINRFPDALLRAGRVDVIKHLDKPYWL